MRPRTQRITPRYDYLLATCLNDAGTCNASWKNILKNPLQNKWLCLYKQAPSYCSASKYQHKLHNTKSSGLLCIIKITAMTEPCGCRMETCQSCRTKLKQNLFSVSVWHWFHHQRVYVEALWMSVNLASFMLQQATEYICVCVECVL